MKAVAKMKSMLKVYAILLSVGLVSLFMGHGCSQFSSGGDDNGSSGVLTDESGIIVIPGERTVSTVYAKQILDNMTSCTGIGTPSVATVQEWEARLGTLSEYGYATTLTSPMMMGVVAIAGEICNDILALEIPMADADRIIFDGIDFNAGPGSLARGDIVGVAAKLGRSCWQRDIDTTEESLVVDAVNSIISDGGNAPSDTRNALLAECTGVLSSLSAIEQ